MRIVELTAHVQTISRTRTPESPNGKTATAAAAYRSCSVIACERTGLTYDYRRKGGLVATGITVPADAPAWAKDRAQLWNAAEMKERNGSRGPNAKAFREKAVVAREIMFGFPAELSEQARLNVSETVARHLVDVYGVGADFAIHEPGKEGDQRNYHCHLMMTTRRLTGDGLGLKTREWDAQANGPGHVKAIRAFLAKTMNDALTAEGKAGLVFVEHRSFKDRGKTQRPTRHQGKGKTNPQRQARKQTRDGWLTKERTRQSDRHKGEWATLQARQEVARTKESTDRQTLSIVHERETRAMTERHRSEDQQLAKVAAARVLFDRVAEVQARRHEVRQQEREHLHDHEQRRT